MIEEIIVTGEFRRTTVQDTSASVSVVPLADYRSGTVNHLEEVLGWLPNVNYASGGSRARFLQIRGIGERGQFAEPLNPSVALMIDGVDLTSLGSAATLFDVEQVEVLRGPQGTLYGANALAGLVNVRTPDPTTRWGGRAQFDAGDYAAAGVGGVLSGPVDERLGLRVSGRVYRDDGFYRNAYLDRDDTGARDEVTLRGKLRFEPDERQAWTVGVGHIDVDNGFDAFTLDGSRRTRSDAPGQDQQRVTYGSLGLERDFASSSRFEGVLALARGETDYGYDEDWTFDGFHPDGYASTDRYLRDRETASVDLRWLSGPSGRLFDAADWVIGVYGLTEEAALERQYTFADAFDSDHTIDRGAVYGEVVQPLSETLRLTAGLRFEHYRSSYRDSAGVRFDPDDALLGGRVVLSWDYRAGAMAYASVARGYKPGGFNISGTLDADLREYDPEALWNYELGLKGRWLDDRLEASVSLFAMHRDDVQVGTSITRVRADGSAEFIDLISNAAEGDNRGLELETRYRLAAPVTLFASLGLLNSAFDDFINSSGEDLDGESEAHAPEWQTWFGAEYAFAPGWYLRLEGEGKDAFFFSNSERYVPRQSDVHSSAYLLWHASLGYDSERFGVKLWARNLGDEDVATRGYYFGNDPRDGYAARGYTQLGEPRRIGITLTVWN
ncbi:MAG: TonB-dependent receptor [Gammaproteobacteria bacterium]